MNVPLVLHLEPAGAEGDSRPCSAPDGTAPAELRRRRLQRFPYAVVFAESATEYVVIAVMHLRRRPGYWLSRLGESG